MLLALTILLH